MCADNTKGEAFALADAFYAACQVVAQFIDDKVRRPMDERVGSVAHGIVFQVQMLRAIAWLRSLGKLNHPGDFQAVTAAARSLFEGAVDVTLMHFDEASFSPEKMDAWEDSAKLKHAQTVAAYFAELGRDPSDEGRTILAYASREKPRIEKLRARWWPNQDGKHPPRWTGRDLAADAKAADRLLAEGFEDFYRLRYPQICWNVHGSGAAGIANISPEHFPFVGGRAYGEAAKFARVVAEVVARRMGCWDEAAFKNLAERLTLAKGAVYFANRGNATWRNTMAEPGFTKGEGRCGACGGSIRYEFTESSPRRLRETVVPCSGCARDYQLEIIEDSRGVHVRTMEFTDRQ